MNSSEIVLMYYINAHTDTTGKFCVGRIDIASLLDCTVVTAAKRIQPLIDYGYVVEVRKPQMRGAGYKYVYHVTPHGVNDIQAIWQSAHAAYKAHIDAKLLAALEEVKRISKARGKAQKIHPKQAVLL